MSDKPNVVFEELEVRFRRHSGHCPVDVASRLYRAKVPGGWLLKYDERDGAAGLTFMPDPEHAWDGNSLDWSDSLQRG